MEQVGYSDRRRKWSEAKMLITAPAARTLVSQALCLQLYTILPQARRVSCPGSSEEENEAQKLQFIQKKKV